MKTIKKMLKGISISMLFASLSCATTFVDLFDISQDNSILETGDGIYVDVNLSQILLTDTLVTLDFNDSTASYNEDFRVRNVVTGEEISLNQENKAVIRIYAGNLKTSLFIYSLKDCISETNESIDIKITNPNNGVELGSLLNITTQIEDSPYSPDYFYISDEFGDDNNDGSCETPIKTLSLGIYRFRESDKSRFIIGNGVYTGSENRNVTLSSKSGTVEKPIVIQAQYAGHVSFVGERPDIRRQGPYGFGLRIQEVQNVIVRGLMFKNFGTGLMVYTNPPNTMTKNISIEDSTFKDNSDGGISIQNSENIMVKNSTFIGSIPPNNSINTAGEVCTSFQNKCAIQDYGVSAYNSSNISVMDNYFYGRHNQVVSFKEGVINGRVDRNIFVGALHTAIFFGQNFTAGSLISRNLTANYNIVLAKQDFPVKSPIRIDNVEHASASHNYFQDFDFSNNLSAFFILKRATGTIDISNNILAFGQGESNPNDFNNAGAFEVSDDNDDNNSASNCPSPEINININNNIVYKVHHSLTQNMCSFLANENNTTLYKLFDDPSGSTNVNSAFLSDPIKTNRSFGAYLINFDDLYQELTNPFILQ